MSTPATGGRLRRAGPQQAIESLKSTAADAASHVQQSATEAAQGVTDQVGQSKDHLTAGR